MSTKNLVLGAAATCLAIGGAYASFKNVAGTIWVKVNGTPKEVNILGTVPTCPGGSGSVCQIKVRTRNGVNTVDAVATLVASTGSHATIASTGAFFSTIARTIP